MKGELLRVMRAFALNMKRSYCCIVQPECGPKYSEPTSGKARFYLGKEAVPRHRLQALLAKGDFDQALELARAFNMDENDVHAARLLALLREAGSVSSGT